MESFLRDNLLDKNETALKNAASLGWTIPIDLPPSTFLDFFSKPTHELIDVDIELGNYYLEHIEDLFSSIESQLKFLPKYLQQLIEESIECFKNGLFQVCIPSLFSALEGIMTFYVENRRATKYKELHEVISKSDGIVLEVLGLKSIAYFLERHFKGTDFEETSQDFSELNRHWALHGKYNQPHEKKSVVKLFVATGTALMNAALLMSDNKEF